MNFTGTVPGMIMAILAAVSAVFWWQEARKKEEKLNLRGKVSRRMTFIFGGIALLQYFVWG